MNTLKNYYGLVNKMRLLLLGLFVFIHIFNHLILVISIKEHISFMENFRFIYRNIYIESILLLAFLFQIIKSINATWRERKNRRTFFELLVFISKIYLIYFLINHISAVLFGRIVFNLDTNIYYAIAGLHVFPYSFYFIPYYFLSIICLFFYFSKNKKSYSFYTINSIGFILAIVLLFALKSVFYDINIPIEYLDMY